MSLDSLSAPIAPSSSASRTIALAGNPNCGKTTLFNALTGLRQRVGNYAGVTVEKKEGKLQVGETDVNVVDIPGIYSLSARSLDEQVARNVLLGTQADASRPDFIVSIVDASNLERNLYLTTQLMELGRPVLVALNMMDVAAQNGIDIDAAALGEALGVPVLPIVASREVGLEPLKRRLVEPLPPLPKRHWKLAPSLEDEIKKLADFLTEHQLIEPLAAEGEAIRLLLNDMEAAPVQIELPPELENRIIQARERLEAADIDWWAVEAEARYGWIKHICAHAVVTAEGFKHTTSDKIDRVVTHRILGPLFFAFILILVFESISRFAQYPMDLIGGFFDYAGDWVRGLVPPGDMQGLLADGVIPGVGGVITFLPQILILSFFISLLEDSGYMARAAFIMDRIMRRVGLNGKSFIPLLSSFACAIPGIMATRTIENPKDRLVTILIAPLMSCSARLPVYLLMIHTFFPSGKRIGIFSTQTVVLFSMYVLGIVAAIGMGWLFKKTLLRGHSPPLIMELPPYRFPAWRNVFSTMLTRAGQFLQRAGTVILAISMVLWFLAAYPKNIQLSRNYATERQQMETRFQAGQLTEAEKEQQLAELKVAEASERSRKSYLGTMGHTLEPAIRPLGFNWKIGIGLISAFAAREVIISTMAIVYSVGDDEANENTQSLQKALQNDRYPDGRPVYTPLVAVALMVFFVLALQCMSTFAIVRRETNSWRWPFFMLGYMTALAYVTTLIVYQGGRMLGF
ncbi:MAG: ferrous iron transport protein B [Blastocatellia bacterium]|nr:ferrous iron transport protein B [Blastocatellia bacterium]